MGHLTLSLILVVITSVIGLGWIIDQWYTHYYSPPENETVVAYKQIGRELVDLIAVADLNSEQVEDWVASRRAAVVQGASPIPPSVQLTPYADFLLPDNLKKNFEAGEPLLLDTGELVSLNYFLLKQHSVLSLNFPDTARTAQGERLSWILTLLFYGGIVLIVLLWLYPLLQRLNVLRHVARQFGAGDLSARIPEARTSYISDIEKEFNRMAQQIDNLVYDNKLLSRGLSHDLRTPIARLRFGLDVLDEAVLSPEQQKTLAHLNRDLTAMEGLIETLLSYARLEQAKITMKTELIDIKTFASNLIDDFYADTLRYLCETLSAEVSISGDREYLSMMMHNLIQNAERHGRGEVIVRLVESDAHISLSVEDNGPGIPLHEREHVLKPFYRVASAQHTQGHGMGLAIVDRIAQWHGADVVLGISESLGGLKIKIDFPIAK